MKTKTKKLLHPEPTVHDPNYTGPTWYAIEQINGDGTWRRFRNQFSMFPDVVYGLRSIYVSWPIDPRDSDVRVVHVSARYPELFQVVTVNRSTSDPYVR